MTNKKKKKKKRKKKKKKKKNNQGQNDKKRHESWCVCFLSLPTKMGFSKKKMTNDSNSKEQ